MNSEMAYGPLIGKTTTEQLKWSSKVILIDKQNFDFKCKIISQGERFSVRLPRS